MDNIEKIRADLKNGLISREQFWLNMQERHLGLREYQDLMRDSDVVEISITPDALSIATKDGVNIVWHPEDIRTASNVLINTGEYEAIESAALAKGAENARVIFDIGANIGYYSTHWARQLVHGGTLHAFEPVPSTYDRLVQNIEMNGLSERVILNNCGLGDEITTLKMYLPEFSGSGAASMVDLHPDEGSIEVEVPVNTLDAYFVSQDLDAFDMAKIDVEGAEIMVLRGGEESIRRYKPLLFVELLRKWSKPFGYHPNDVIDMLAEWGYSCFTHEGENLVAFSRMTDETLQTNFFFAHPDRHRAWLSSNGVSDSAFAR